MARDPPLLHALPVLAALAWLGAVLWSGRVNPWGPFGADPAFYGASPPAWLFWALAAAGAAALGAAVWTRRLPFAYLAVAPVAVIAGGAKQLASRGLPDVLAFAVLALATIELLTVRARFQGIVDSARNLAKEEQPPLAGFMVRYAVALALACAGLAAALWVLVAGVAPLLAHAFSARLAQGVELESAVGISLFVAIPLATAVAVRLLVDGLRARRAPAAAPAADIQDLRPIAREESQ